ncbi:hypothetical protein ACFO4P_05105 [Epilithonimonas pallida]|uniref:Uncharacterized protein n=1 Tax=Epilithonimonas pallida TaxID=373671 RepID=A0ABY1QZH8_9FLAO|nr:hypothetical protein [Epilithonimonas pallida]SMP90041.1 hypothetical protein SAMN05421679_102168 [Epilithonimonas pallida]
MSLIKPLGVNKIKRLTLENPFGTSVKKQNKQSNISDKINNLEDYILDAYWTNRSGQKVTRAKFGDIVKFNLLVSNDVPENTTFLLQPYEENRIKDVSLGEVKDITVKSNGKNKFGSIELFLNYDWDYILDEIGEGAELELYCQISNWGETVKLPFNGRGRLAVELRDIPQLILVNGHWDRTLEIFNVAPGGGREYYWDYFLGKSRKKIGKNFFSVKNLDILKDNACSYYRIETNKNFFYFDGSSLGGGTSSGDARKQLGKETAKKKFGKLLDTMKRKKYYFISHSEGGAFASGVAEYLVENGIEVGEHITLSCDEADEFEANAKVPTYQLSPVYFTKDSNVLKEIANVIRFASHSQQIKKYGNYYAVVDWMVGDFHLKNVKKYGIIIIKEGGDWKTIHTCLINPNLFKWVDDLKEARIFIGTNTSQGAVKNKTEFYKINDTFITDNIPK